MPTNQRRGGIERKILWTILWVGIIPTLIAVLVGYFITHEAQKRAVQRMLSTAANKTASGVLLALNSRLRTVRTLSRDPEIINAMTAGIEDEQTRTALIERLKAEAHGAEEDAPSVYSLFNAEGRFVLSTGTLALWDRNHAAWAPKVTEASFMAFRYVPEQNRHCARAVAPIYVPKTNQLVGFLCEDQDATKLLEFVLGHDSLVSEDELGKDLYQVAFAGEQGGALMYYMDPKTTPPVRTEGADVKFQAQITGPKAKESGTLRIRNYAAQGTVRDVLLAYHRFMGKEDSYRMYIVVSRPAVAAFSSINQWAIFSILGALLLVGAFCIVAYRTVHNTIVLPLSLLNEGAQIIRQGDLDLKLKITTGDEIEELASSFNKMALALSQNIRQLEDSEEKYRSLVTSMPDGIYQTDPGGVISFVNPAGAEIFGYDSPQDAISQNLRELFLEEIDFARMANELTKHAVIERTRVWMKRKDGRSICVEISGNRVLDDEGAFVGAEGIFRDVTASVRLEQQARERSERISAINQIANVINSSIEAGRLHESLIVELKKLVNFDYASVALLDDKGDGFEKRELWPARRATVNVTSAAAAASATAWVVHQRKSLSIEDLRNQPSETASEFPEETGSCLCVPLYATGRIIGTLNLGSNRPFAFTKHDIEVLEEMSPHIAVAMRNARLLENLQQSLEEVTRAREKLHEANEELKTLDEMKTNLLSNVSHELRTPLVAVMGYTDMIYNHKVGPINEVQHDYLGIILRNIEKLVTLIENLLDFSRLHRGTERLVFDTFDIVDCARTSIQTIQPIADSRSIAVSCVFSDEQIPVEGDKGKMGQVFNNLLSNAVKFNSSGGTVTVGIQRREDSVEVTVMDTGIGIPPEALDKVFTRFYQYDSSSTRKYGGTGIGLSIAQDIVRLHGSRITVTSEVGRGSIFRFALPLTASQIAEESETEGEGEPGSEPALASETSLLVLLITRDRGLGLQVHDFVMPEGIGLLHATQADSAIALIRKYDPECVLFDVDYTARDETGARSREMLDALLADAAASALPIILLTNNDEFHEEYRARVASRVRHGFRKSVLLSAIHYVTLSHPSPRPAEAQPLGNKILCVDDDAEVLVFITRCLETDGYTVDSCPAGQAALDRLASREYGLVLLDIAMPGLDGWEVCRRIKTDAALAGIKVYLVTAKPIDRSAARIQSVGADGYLLKPFKPEDLAELVHGAIPAPAAHA